MSRNTEVESLQNEADDLALANRSIKVAMTDLRIELEQSRQSLRESEYREKELKRKCQILEDQNKLHRGGVTIS